MRINEKGVVISLDNDIVKLWEQHGWRVKSIRVDKAKDGFVWLIEAEWSKPM